MRTFHIVVVSLFMSFALADSAVAGSPPQLPGAESFELSVREEFASSMPLSEPAWRAMDPKPKSFASW